MHSSSKHLPPVHIHRQPVITKLNTLSYLKCGNESRELFAYVIRQDVGQGQPFIFIYSLMLFTFSEINGANICLLIIFHLGTYWQGSLEDHGSLVAAVKQVDIVISCVGVQISDQLRIIDAIKQVGTIKVSPSILDLELELGGDLKYLMINILVVHRFLPSKFENDVYRVQAVEPAKGLFGLKVQIRRAVEAAGIPYTYVSSNTFAGYFLANLVQPGLTAPPRDKVVIYGDGNAKAVMTEEEDIATYTIKAVDDPRTLNKTLYLRPSANTKSQNELVALWEHKIGKALEKVILPEEQLLQQIQDTQFPNNIVLSIVHDIFARGDQCNFEIGENGVEGSQLYPEVNYTIVDEYLNKFVSHVNAL
eukprot:Gb_34970 [translate_table: standard]